VKKAVHWDVKLAGHLAVLKVDLTAAWKAFPRAVQKAA
jgi:hypothetical protein